MCTAIMHACHLKDAPENMFIPSHIRVKHGIIARKQDFEIICQHWKHLGCKSKNKCQNWFNASKPESLCS